MRAIFVLVLMASAIAIVQTPALAARGKDNRVSPDSTKRAVACPPGTCNRRGGPRARDVSFCSASNCRK